MVAISSTGRPVSSLPIKTAILSFLCGFSVAKFLFGRPVPVSEISSMGMKLGVEQTSSSLSHSQNRPLGEDITRHSSSQSPKFVDIGAHSGTDKVRGSLNFQQCLQNPSHCSHPDALNPRCRVLSGHFYDTMYQRWLEPWQQERFQFLEIGFYNGNGFAAYQKFLPHAEHHSLEISCIETGPRSEGKWPQEWGNFASKSPQYDTLIANQRLHCADASLWDKLQETYRNIRTSSSLPLKVVVEDGSHLSDHMAITVLFWFPRIAPGGILVVEDIESQTTANDFRQYFLPRLVQDLHFCGMPSEQGQQKNYCLPTLAPLLQSIHCEMHICVLERNQQPSVEYNEHQTMPPSNLFPNNVCWLQNQ